MKIKLPTAVNPPKLVKKYGPVLGYIATVPLMLFAIIHLFRIDKLIPAVEGALSGNLGLTLCFVVVVILAEVFALPFLFRMKLSPLAQIVSGFLVILAPLLWSLLSLWTYGEDVSTGQLGSFINTPSTWWLIALNLIWLSFNFYTLWALGYNNLKVKDLLKK